MKVKYIVTTFIVLCVLALIGNNNNNKIEQEETEKKSNINIISVQNGIKLISYKKSNTGIEVIVKNNTGKEINYIRVDVECYDKDNNRLNDGSGMILNPNTKDNYKDDIYCDIDTEKYNVYIKYY